MAWWGDFAVEASAGLVGVFAGIVLALWVERGRRRKAAVVEEGRQREALADVRRLLLSSIVRDATEARRVQANAADDPYLFGVAFDLAVWDATHAQFFGLASMEERVLFARFFDQVKRLAGLVDFQRRVRADVELRGSPDAGDRALIDMIGARLREVAEDVRLEGHVLVNDHGEAVHKRLLGIKPEQDGLD